MQWLKWGKQSDIFGFPIGLILVFVSGFNLFCVRGLPYLLNSNEVIRFAFHNMGTIGSQHSSDLVRIYMILTTSLCFIWGVLIAVNLGLLRKASWLAYITLLMACSFYCLLSCGIAFGVYLYFVGEYWEFTPELAPFCMTSSPFPWPTSFWASLALNIMLDTLVGVIVLDAHYSYFKIVQHGGTGWENKSYFQVKLDTRDENMPLSLEV